MSDKTKAMCRGCREDYYNGQGGCWCYDSARVCRRAFVHLSMIPPWAVEPETTLTCHRRPQHVAIRPDHPQLTRDSTHAQKYDGGSYG